MSPEGQFRTSLDRGEAYLGKNNASSLRVDFTNDT
jgi:hypothetical protein